MQRRGGRWKLEGVTRREKKNKWHFSVCNRDPRSSPLPAFERYVDDDGMYLGMRGA